MSEPRKVTLVTGARKGIGRHLVEHFLEIGHSVVGCSREAATAPSEHYHHFSLDITDERKVVQMVTEIRRKFGRLDHLINNAGIASMNHFLLTPTASARQIIETNYLGTFTATREAVRLMSKNKYGRIVNFSSVAVPLNLDGEAAYAASKAAVEKLTEISAREVASLGITVNAIGPTPIKTDLIRSVPESKLASLVERQAIKRFGEYSDVTNAVEFFLRPESSFVTGQVLYLGGVG